MVECMKITENSVIFETFKRLSKAFQIQKIILFGSRATGQYHPDSDYDLIFIVKDPRISYLKRLRIAREALWDLSVPIDLFIYTQSEFDALKELPNTLPQIALQVGIEIEAA
jgi:uncharacterized protein